MKKIFYLGILLLLVFEVANIYFIMPMPGSQRMRSINIAYLVHQWRWAFRIAFAALVVAGAWSACVTPGWRKWLAPVSLLVVAGVAYAANFKLAADSMVLNDTVGGKPIVLVLAADSASFFAFERPDDASRFAVRSDSLVAGARAYAFTGRGDAGSLKPVFASQEFWHSWREFHPGTATY